MLPKRNRLKKRRDFENVIRNGESFLAKSFKLKKIKNNLNITRFGIILSKKITKKATKRNRIKRKIREFLRINIKKIKPNYDVVFFLKKEIKFSEIEKEIAKILKKAKLLK